MQIVAFIGPPAAGKTTLIKRLSGHASVFRLRREVPVSVLIDGEGNAKEWLEYDLVAGAFTRAVRRELGTSTELLLCDNFPGNGQQVDLLADAVARPGVARGMVVALCAPMDVLVERARRRRVCAACEPDPLGDPRTPAVKSAETTDRCAVCDSVLQGRRNDRRTALIARVRRYQRNIETIERRCRDRKVRLATVDASGSPEATELSVRPYLARGWPARE